MKCVNCPFFIQLRDEDTGESYLRALYREPELDMPVCWNAIDCCTY